MGAPACDDRTFIELFETIGPDRTKDQLKTTLRNVYARRERLERRTGRSILAPAQQVIKIEHPQRVCFDVQDGTVLVASDGHYWPGRIPTAHKALIKFSKEYKPKLIVFNGDAFDGASISRHPAMNWEKQPTVKEEIEAVQERLGEIEKAAFKARKIWTLGNHDSRFESRLAMVAREYAEVQGVHLKDHFPNWEGAWACWINDSVVIKHRHKGGIHATHNATLWAGKTMITGHLHSLKVTPFSDYNGTRFGVDTGCIADPYGPQFDYNEDNPRNHRSGFIVLTFRDGVLMWPEVVAVVDRDHVQFRGEILKV